MKKMTKNQNPQINNLTKIVGVFLLVVISVTIAQYQPLPVEGAEFDIHTPPNGQSDYDQAEQTAIDLLKDTLFFKLYGNPDSIQIGLGISTLDYPASMITIPVTFTTNNDETHTILFSFKRGDDNTFKVTSMVLDKETEYLMEDQEILTLLAENEWSLHEMIVDGSDVDVLQYGITLQYVEGNLAGKGVCNRYFADASVTDGTLSVGMVGATLMACPEGMDIEAQYFTVLPEMVEIEYTGDQLILGNHEGTSVLVFKVN